MNRKTVARMRTVLLSAIIGAGAAYSVAHVVQFRKGGHALAAYAQRLELAKEAINQESTKALLDVAHNGLTPCSDSDLAYMRDYVYRSAHIRDLGRIGSHSELLCTSGTGRLSPPIVPGDYPAYIQGDLRIYPSVPLLISRKSKGFIVERYGVSLVLNPESYTYLDEPPLLASAVLVDRAKSAVLPAFGHPVPLTVPELLAETFVERNGMFYQPICRPGSPVCVVAGESRAALLRQDRKLVVVITTLGALLGAAFGFLIAEVRRGRESIQNQLRRALRHGSLSLEYQPIVNLETGVMVGAEALVRWINEEGKVMSPEYLVALAARSGFAGDVAKFVVQRSLAEMRDLLQQEDFRITLNIESYDLADPTFFVHLGKCLAASKVPATRVGFEVTERSTADHTPALHGIEQLKAAGHRVYIDDFGTGYSNLAYLHQLNVDAIKIDRTFTQTVGTGAVTASAVPQILDMAAKLDLLVVVEGIETKEQAEYFRRAGRGILGQGWLFGKPLSADQFHRVYKSSRT